MIMKRSVIFLFLCFLALASCSREEACETECVTITLSLPSEKTIIGDLEGDTRPMYWANGDKICVNGIVSQPLSGIPDKSKSASFVIPGTSLELPYRIVYPASIWSSNTKVILPATASSIPLAGYVQENNSTGVQAISSVLHFSLVAGTHNTHKIAYVELYRSSKQMCGAFNIDFASGIISPAEKVSKDNNYVRVAVGTALSSAVTDVFVPVPAGTYAAVVRVVDVAGHYMDKEISSRSFSAGSVHSFPTIAFEPTGTLVDISLDYAPEDCTISGCVKGDDGKALEGVVVSDGHICTKTDSKGLYYLASDLSDVDFVFVSTPSGYAAPVADALPIFYKRFDSLTASADGRYENVNFTLNKIDNPSQFTMLIAADPQPRSSGATYDKIAYHSLTCCKDLYREMKETGAAISGRKVYGLMLGDICHNDISLYANYKTGMSTNGFPTYNVIGNHDHNLATVGDKESAKKFEEYFGPTNYSFNLGGIHFVVVDNMIITDKPRTSNSSDDYADGLRDDIWEWMANDLREVDASCTIMLCSHSPIFKTLGESQRSRSNKHYADLDALLAKRSGKVYAWAGHTHTMYHYVNLSDPKIESHTVSRSTGELWTNEYMATGVPRGFVVFNCDNGVVSWKFHPTRYQTGSHCMSTHPSYTYRAWNYNSSGVAVMKNGGVALDEKYQMNVYAPGTYDSGDNTIYAVLFMWDNLWELPTLSYGGSSAVNMTRIKTDSKYLFYDKETYDYHNWYKTNNSTLRNDDSYSTASKANCYAVFKATITPKAGYNSATISVKDRFGNTYSSVVSW